MGLTKKAYRALEGVVGGDYMSSDPVILDSYARRSGMAAGRDWFVPRYEAVLLPSNTEEVQAVVKACNQHGIQFKASSTGWGFFSDPAGPGAVLMDLRRMNHIVEIDEDGMYAVVEPYVIGAELQAALMQKGLMANIIGAGSNCSAHPLVGHVGGGHTAQTTSCNERCVLGAEWVTPEGEIVRLGSLGSLNEWFCGDGPGPSLRGIIRGVSVPLGGLGVFTQAAMKLYHWPGPARMAIEGRSPKYYPDRIPDNFLLRYLSFPSFEKMFEAVQKIGETEIAFELMAFHRGMLASNIATSNEEDVELRRLFDEQTQGPGFLVILAGISQDDLEYKARVLQMISEETSAKSAELVEDEKVGGGLMWRCIRITASIRETFRATGIFGGAQGGHGSFACMFEYIEKVARKKAELSAEGVLYDDAAGAMGWTIEHGHLAHGEMLIRYFAREDGPNPSMEILDAGNEIALSDHYGVPHSTAGDGLHDLFGPSACNYHDWLRKIKGSFDPQGTSEASGYITCEESTESARPLE